MGPDTGTASDPAGTGILAPLGDLDCVDEAVNTTRLLMMLDDGGLLTFHSAGRPVHRAFVGNSRTHMTAVMREKGGVAWAVELVVPRQRTARRDCRAQPLARWLGALAPGLEPVASALRTLRTQAPKVGWIMAA